MPWQKEHFHYTMRIAALTRVINDADQRLSKAKSQLAHVWDPEPEKGLKNILAWHQEGDPCIRSCHSHYGMWHSVAPTPVAWCILMSKMLWVRVTRHGWYRTEKPPSIISLSLYAGFLGYILSTAPLQCHISCFGKKAGWLKQPGLLMTVFNFFSSHVKQVLFWSFKWWKHALCKTISHLDEALKSLYPQRNNKHGHHSVVLPSHIITFNKQDQVHITLAALMNHIRLW